MSKRGLVGEIVVPEWAVPTTEDDAGWRFGPWKPREVWTNARCGHCGSRNYGVEVDQFADRCFDCRKIGYRLLRSRRA